MSKIIAFCGLDGSGKTTQIQLVEKYFLEKSYKVEKCKLPSDWYRVDSRVRDLLDEKLGDSISVLSEFALLAACDRQRWTNTELKRMKSNADIILCDRHVYSTYAYFLARGYNDLEWLMSINRHIGMPDMTFYIDVPPEISVDRVRKRDGKERKKEEANLAKMERVRNIYLSQPWGKNQPFIFVDGTLPQSDISSQIINQIEKQL